jgi:hypothetical protein
MGFIDILNRAAEISEASLIKFFQQYRRRDNAIHIFFEGNEDQSFYSNYIDQYFGIDKPRYYYISNGKDNVYQNYKDINWDSYLKNRVMFFVDKDLDDTIGRVRPFDENIFVTKYYSVENYLATANMLEKILREFCFVNEDDVLQKIKNKYIDQQRLFFNKLTMILGWISYCRLNNLNLNLGDFLIGDLFYLDDDFNLRKRKTVDGMKPFKYICETTGTEHFSFTEIRNMSLIVSQTEDYKTVMRGKYDLWLLFAFYDKTVRVVIPKVNQIIKEHNRKNARKRSRCKIMVPVTLENILLLSAPKLLIPDDLKEFLQVRKELYSALSV